MTDLLPRLRATLPGRLLLVCAGIGAGAAAGGIAGGLLPLVLPVHPTVLPELPGLLTTTGVYLGAIVGAAGIGFRRAVPAALAVTVGIIFKSLLGFADTIDSGEWLRMVVPPLASVFALAAAIPALRPGEGPGSEMRYWWNSMRGLAPPRQP